MSGPKLCLFILDQTKLKDLKKISYLKWLRLLFLCIYLLLAMQLRLQLCINHNIRINAYLYQLKNNLRFERGFPTPRVEQHIPHTRALKFPTPRVEQYRIGDFKVYTLPSLLLTFRGNIQHHFTTFIPRTKHPSIKVKQETQLQKLMHLVNVIC